MTWHISGSTGKIRWGSNAPWRTFANWLDATVSNTQVCFQLLAGSLSWHFDLDSSDCSSSWKNTDTYATTPCTVGPPVNKSFTLKKNLSVSLNMNILFSLSSLCPKARKWLQESTLDVICHKMTGVQDSLVHRNSIQSHEHGTIQWNSNSITMLTATVWWLTAFEIFRYRKKH